VLTSSATGTTNTIAGLAPVELSINLTPERRAFVAKCACALCTCVRARRGTLHRRREEILRRHDAEECADHAAEQPRGDAHCFCMLIALCACPTSPLLGRCETAAVAYIKNISVTRVRACIRALCLCSCALCIYVCMYGSMSGCFYQSIYLCVSICMYGALRQRHGVECGSEVEVCVSVFERE
jgi:hypothetical protein